MASGRLIGMLILLAVLGLAGGWWLLDAAVADEDVTRERNPQSGRTGASAGRSAGNAARVSDRESRDVSAAEMAAEGQGAGAREMSAQKSEDGASKAGGDGSVPSSNKTPVVVTPKTAVTTVKPSSPEVVTSASEEKLSEAAAAYKEFSSLEAKDAKDDQTTELRSANWTQERLESRMRAKGIELPPTILTEVTGKVMVHGVNKALPYARVVLHSFVPERNIRGAHLVPFATEFLCDEKGQFTGRVPLGETKPDDYPALVVSVWVGDTIPQYDADKIPAKGAAIPPIQAGQLAICGRPVITGAPGQTTALGIFFAPDHPVNLAVEGTSVAESIGAPIRFTGQADPARWHPTTRRESLELFPLLRSQSMWRLESGEERHIYRYFADPGKTQFLAVMSGANMLRAETRRLVPNEQEKALGFWQLSPVDGRLYAHRAKFNPVGTLGVSGQILTSAAGGLDGAQVLARGGREIVTTVSGSGGWFTLEGVVSSGSVIEVSHELWSTEIIPFNTLRRMKPPTVTMTAPRPDFTLNARSFEDAEPIKHLVMRVVWLRKKLVKGKVVTEEFSEVLNMGSADGRYRVTGEWAIKSLVVSAEGFRPHTVDPKPLSGFQGNVADVIMSPTRAFNVKPAEATLMQTRPDGAKWEVPADNSGHVYTNWSHLSIEYTVNFDQGLPEGMARPVPFDLVIGARNQGIVDNNYAFRVNVYVDGKHIGHRTIFADTKNERTATIALGELSGTRVVRLVWVNDKWIPGELDANIRLTSLRFVETIAPEPTAKAK